MFCRHSLQRHRLDEGSLDLAIARKTLIIRDMQRHMLEEQEDFDEENPALRHVLKLNVDQRRGYLRRLRETDYPRFEWLLEKLDLVYKPRPFHYDRVERKKHLERLTVRKKKSCILYRYIKSSQLCNVAWEILIFNLNILLNIVSKKMLYSPQDLWCDELKQHRLGELEDRLRREQPGYLRQKAETLRWARREQAELGMEVTVTEEEAEECVRRAEEVEAEIREAEEKAGEAGESDSYYIYEPEDTDTSQKYIA